MVDPVFPVLSPIFDSHIGMCNTLCVKTVHFGGKNMPTNLGIDDALLAEAMQLGKLPTKKATVNQALEEYVKRLRQIKAMELFGKIDFDPSYDYKKERNRKRGFNK
jgi:Arc/MetJ family transcription regulator